MASGPITSWQIKGEKVDVVTEFLFLGSKTTADGDCSQEMRRQLLLGRKAMTNLDSVLKSRDVTLPAKICIVKAMVFPLVTYGCESWTVKKAECQRVDAFELWCRRRLLKVRWTARRSNQSILRELNPEYSLEGLKLKRQYFGHLTQADNLVEKSLNAREDWGQKEERLSEDETGWMASLTQWTWVWVNSGSWWWRGRPGVLQSTQLQRVGHDRATEQHSR